MELELFRERSRHTRICPAPLCDARGGDDLPARGDKEAAGLWGTCNADGGRLVSIERITNVDRKS
eukprot:4452091-Pyramimonas_sp.AAC.1